MTSLRVVEFWISRIDPPLQGEPFSGASPFAMRPLLYPHLKRWQPSTSVQSRAMQRRTLGAVALVLLPIALADDAVVAAAAASSGITGFGEAFMASIGVIFGTELGDKTFFIAAIMSMRPPRFTVWFGAVGALAAMTVLSTIVGHVAPMLLPPAVRRSTNNIRHHRTASNLPLRVSPLSPLLSLAPHAPSLSPSPLTIALSLLSLPVSLLPQVTHYAAVCLFLVFGARMLNESRQASNAASDELEEVEAELSKKQATYTSVGTQDTVRIPRTPERGEEGARTRRQGQVATHPMGWTWWFGERGGEGVG